MNIRTKLAAVTLAAGTLIGGGAMATMSSAGAAPVKVDPGLGPIQTIGPIYTVPPTIGPFDTVPVKDWCKYFPELCKPSTTTTAKPQGSTTTTKVDPKDPKNPGNPGNPYDPPTENVDPTVKARPAFTG